MMANHKDIDISNLKVDLVADVTNPSGYSCHARNMAKTLAPICNLSLPLFSYNQMTDCISHDDLIFIMDLVKDKRAADITLHFSLPPRWDPCPSSYNIGVLSWETSKIPDKDINLNDGRNPIHNNWAKQCNRVDEIWTFSETSKGAIEAAGVTVPVYIFTGPIDTDFWSPESPILDKGILGVTHDHRGQSLSSKFIAGYIADFSERKDIDTFISCSLVALPPEDSVVVLKTMNSITKESVIDICRQIKGRMVMHKLPPLVVVDNMMKDEEIRGLLQSFTTYVCPSRAEGLNLPLMQAMSMEKCVIAGRHSAHVEYIDGKNGILLPINLELVRTMVKNPWYQNDQIWGKVNEVALIQTLQGLHKKWKEGGKSGIKCPDARKKIVNDHSFNALRPKFRKRLQQILRDGVGTQRLVQDQETQSQPKIPPLPKRPVQ